MTNINMMTSQELTDAEIELVAGAGFFAGIGGSIIGAGVGGFYGGVAGVGIGFTAGGSAGQSLVRPQVMEWAP